MFSLAPRNSLVEVKNGIMLIDKPPGMTSHDVVNAIRRKLHIRRVGHTGILDPAATGLMILLIDRGTLLSSWLTGLPKRYVARFAFGATMDTYDADGEELSRSDPGEVSEDNFARMLPDYSGEIEQIIPPYSAVKRQGKKFYKLARKGMEFSPGLKVVDIKNIELVEFRWPEVALDINCSLGTYVRSLAHQMGQRLGCGGYLKTLRRIEVGPFRLSEAHTLDDAMASDSPESFIKPLKQALPMIPGVAIKERYCGAVLGGRPLVKKYFMENAYTGHGGELSLLLDPEERVLALAKLNMNWGSAERLGPGEIMGSYVRVIDEGHIRNK